MADKILQGMLTTKAVMLPCVLGAQIAASTDDGVVARVVVPFRFRFIGASYDLTVAGSTGGTDDLLARVAGTAVTAAADPANGAGVINGWLDASSRNKDYAANSMVTVTIDTASESTVEIGSTCTIVVQPIGGK